MPKIKTYETRLPESITGNEYVLITDLSEEHSYKINLSDYIVEVAPDSGGGTGVTGTFKSGLGETVTVVDGLITNITDPE